MIITIGRKPFKGAVIDNVTKNHCGGINIDGSRITFQTDGVRKETKRTPRDDTAVWTDKNSGMKKENSLYADADPRGRFPANLILQHLEGCQCVGQSQTKGKEGGYSYTDKTYKVEGFIGTCKPKAPSNYGGEIVGDWVCVEGCPIRTIDRQGEGLVSRYFKCLSKGGRNEES